MTDFKTLVYHLSTSTPSVSGDSTALTVNTSGDFQFTSQQINPEDVSFNNGANWSDQTTSVKPSDTAGVNLLNIGGINYGAVGSVWYFGSSSKFDTLSLLFTLNTGNNAGRTILYEYWNGSAWTTLVQTAGATQTITASSVLTLININTYTFKIHPNIYDTWATTSVNGGTARYYIRMTIQVAAFSVATLQSVALYDNSGKLGYNRFDKVYTTTDDAAFTDVTFAARSQTAGAFTFTANTTGARLYLGSNSNNVMGFRSACSTAGTVGTGVWEYWNGSTWTTFTAPHTGSLASAVGTNEILRTNVAVTFYMSSPLSNWDASSVNGVTKYWIRFRVTGNYTVSPIFSSIIPYKDQTLSNTIYIPETTNRNFESVFAKIHMYNPIIASPTKLQIWGRLGSNTFIPVGVGESGTVTGTFYSIGGKVFSTTANDGVFTDETDDASDSGVNDVTVTNSINANLYFCYPNDARWAKNRLYLNMSPQTAAAGGVCVWEYWNGSAWTAFTPTVYRADVNLNQKVNNSPYIVIPPLTDWATNTVNGFTGYNLRRRITTTYSTSPATYTSITTSYPGINSATYTNTGENNSQCTLINLTNLFATQFTGTSQQLDLKITCENVSTILGDNMVTCGEVFITYKADNETTRAKTVIIPLSSSSTALTSTLTSIGSSQIPALDTYLPEKSKTIRNFYIVATGEDCVTNSSLFEIGMRLDAEGVRYAVAQTPYGNTGNIVKMIFAQNNINTAATQDIQMSINGPQTNIKNFALYAVVTYEYNSATTDRVINSMMLPFETTSIDLASDNPTSAENIRKSFYIQEPGTIDNERIGCYLSFTDTGAPSINVKEKSESTYTAVSWTAPSFTCGGYRYGWVLPSQNLSRGLNEIGIDAYADLQASLVPSAIYLCGYFLVNYQSDVSTCGIECHNRNIFHVAQVQNLITRLTKTNNAITNPLTYWYLNDIGFMGELYNGDGSANATVSFPVRFLFENITETPSRVTLGASGVASDGESTLFDFITADRNTIKKHSGDLHSNRTIDLFNNNGYWIIDYGLGSFLGGIHTVATYHGIYYNITGSVSGYSGTGAGLTVKFYDNDTQQILFSTTTSAGGTFTATWYDNTRSIICEVYDPTLNKYATSNTGIAGTDTFTINLSNGTSGKKSLVWGG